MFAPRVGCDDAVVRAPARRQRPLTANPSSSGGAHPLLTSKQATCDVAHGFNRGLRFYITRVLPAPVPSSRGKTYSGRNSASREALVAGSDLTGRRRAPGRDGQQRPSDRGARTGETTPQRYFSGAQPWGEFRGDDRALAELFGDRPGLDSHFERLALDSDLTLVWGWEDETVRPPGDFATRTWLDLRPTTRPAAARQTSVSRLRPRRSGI